MTKKERRNHKILNGSRRARIAVGSGVQVADVNRLVKKYEEASRMFGRMAKSGLMKRMMKGGG
jgi:signal recognition particle subunit SRP54